MSGRDGRIDNKRWRDAKRTAIAHAGGYCQYQHCRKPLIPEAPRGTPFATEVDHITPLSQGGDPYLQSNLRAVHRKCHQLITTEQARSVKLNGWHYNDGRWTFWNNGLNNSRDWYGGTRPPGEAA